MIGRLKLEPEIASSGYPNLVCSAWTLEVGTRNRLLEYPNLSWAPEDDPGGSHHTPSPLGKRAGCSESRTPRRGPRWPTQPFWPPAPLPQNPPTPRGVWGRVERERLEREIL